MSILQVGLGERSYPIMIAEGCFADIAKELAASYPASSYCIVSDDNVTRIYGNRLRQSVEETGTACHMLAFPAGEANKNLTTIANLASGAARLGIDRKSMIIALGGGVSGDIAGFLAASYMRGIPFIQVPTSLLAQVDSSIGGKTGVDIPEGKNLMGAFYQPEAVFIDPTVLETLAEKEFLNGLAEVIKHSVIVDDNTLFELLNDRHRQIMALDRSVLGDLIHLSCQIKAGIVGRDEREDGIRRILNFGHTIGHAVEAASGFSILHGFGVAIGMTAAIRIALAKGVLDQARAERIISLIELYNLPTEIPVELDRGAIKNYLLTDKKRIGRKTSYILPVKSGGVIITDAVTDTEIDAVISVKR